MTHVPDGAQAPCRYLGCDRSVSPVVASDATARYALCAVHRPLVRDALGTHSGGGPRLAVREIETESGERSVLVGPR